ncbi:type I methionyl aminopeptidase [Paenibacillus sp. F411]|uniref:type I methionyl aminopeptidase n=1 Tax=Paenibacillus sp. F411 TaxID=2820239 RepID=UPI001AAF0354|nr:type I methionyl aminopeptidase [Paenibacillus sp. F411]MBO2945384.1 type I methionyl aminopeptidase [Paenibacillus sp. F411]
MRINLKSKEEMAYIREAGAIAAACHRQIEQWVRPGATTLEIDERVEEFLRQAGAYPEQKGHKGFPFATCASVNHQICHGFPKPEPLKAGDIVKIDLVVNKNGWLADRGWTYAAGTPCKEAARLMEHTQAALFAGIQQARVGQTIGDIGYILESAAQKGGYGVVKMLVGHGIGQQLHEPPDIPSFGTPGKGRRLKEGMVITIEPVFTLGPTGAVLWEEDGWTISAADGTLGVQYEHTIGITKGGPLILTE